MPRCVPLCSCAALVLLATAGALAQGPPGSPRLARLEQIQEQEGEALIALADGAMTGRRVPADFAVDWHNDFFMASQGTFVPFVVSIETAPLTTSSVLLYVRVARKEPGADLNRAVFPFEDAYPLDVRGPSAGRVNVARGFSVAPGDYDLIVVVRERVDPGDTTRPRKASILRLPLTVPDFRLDQLTTSSIVLAERQRPLSRPLSAEELADRPYAIGLSEVEPCVNGRFRQTDELIVVYLVYNVSGTVERTFDLEVEYHFFLETGGGGPVVGAPDRLRALGRPGERYFNHTKPQRFTPATMGQQFNPSLGRAIMAGQGVPLSGFPEGKYRLLIRITDIIAGKEITRDATFHVVEQ
jgi:hypothetical protein